MKNRKIFAICSLLLVALLVLFVGACKGNSNKPIEPTLTMPEKELVLNKEEISILLGESDYIIVEAAGMDANVTVTFTSSDENVATVDGSGVIQAINVGTATITVKADGVEETCTVNVTLGNFLPELSLKQIDGDEAVIGTDGALNFEPIVIFNHKEYTDATYEYHVANENIGKVENGIFTATGETGDTLVTVYATWRGQSGETIATLQKTIKVKVSIPIIELYTRENFEGEEYKTNADILSIIDDEKATDVQASVTVGDDVIAISNNLITVNKYGSASITITYKNADLKSVEKKIDILVQRPIAEYDESINFSIKDGYIPFTTIWGNEVTIKEAYVGTPLLKGEEISIEDGKVVEGISLNGNKSEQKTITLLTETEGYIVDIDVYTHLIDDANDLVETFTIKDKDVTGAYLVTKDIDASEIDASKHAYRVEKHENADGKTTSTLYIDYKFKGTFDGGGHTITANVSNGGFFSALENATITNANFVLNISGITNGLGYNPTGLAYHAIDTTITDVYAELNVATGLTNASGRTWALSLISNIPTLNDGYIMMQNVVVVNNDDFANLNANTEKHWVGGALFFNDNGRKSAASRAESIKNVFVIAPEQLGNGYYIPMAGGTVQQVFAINDTTGQANAAEKTEQTQYLYDYVTRYATMESMYQNVDLDSLPTSLASKIIKETLIVEVNGSAVNGGVELESGEWNTITLKAGETSLSDLQLHSSDDSIVIVDGNAIKMIGFGVATITATGKVFGIEITQTFSVVMTVETYEQEQLFSGLDGEVDMQTIFGEQAVLLNAYGTDGVAYTVVNGKIADLTNDTNEALTKTLILETTTHKFKKATFKVYTKLIDDASDLEVFKLNDKDIIGYYLVTKDIDASSIAASQHPDFTKEQNNVKANQGFSYKFKGVFDGNGHTVKANVSYGGLFGELEDATITNTKFVLNIGGNISTANNTGNRPTGLAKTALNTTISNVYVELNIGANIATSRNWVLALITTADKTLKMEKVVVVNNDDFSKITPDSKGWIGGALFYTDSARADIASHNAKMKYVFVIAPEQLDNGYYVPMAGGTTKQVFASNDTVGAADAKTKTNVDQAVYTNVTRYADTATFKASDSWGVIPDFIKAILN